ncbi:MAG: hypothetical protein ACI3WR_05885 [Oscillospiraceae bacterium]
MSELFFGYFLLLLRYDLTIAGFTFDILLDFVGYLFLVKGAKVLSEESESIRKTVLPCQILVAASLAAAVLGGFGLLSKIAVVKAVVLVALDLALIFVLYLQVKGISEIEKEKQYLMKGHKLRRDWMLLAVAMLVTHISVYSTVAVIASYAKLLFAVMFLLDLNTAIKGYNGQIPAAAQTEEKTEEQAGESAQKAGEPVISFTAAESEEEEEDT